MSADVMTAGETPASPTGPTGPTDPTGLLGPVLAMTRHLRGRGPLFAVVAFSR